MFNILFLLVLLVASPVSANAFDAVGIMNFLTGKTVSSEATSENSASTSTCGHGAMMSTKTCEIGSGFLCVNTPPFSIVEDTVTIKGTIDVRNNSLTGISASVQNEYTNEYKQLKFGSPDANSDCWNSAANYCLDNNGLYSLKVPLGTKFGPYTVLISATRANGNPSEDKVRLSKVTALSLNKEDIKTANNGQSAIVSIDLLHSCQACDFIGLSTGGVEATITNIITGTDGGTKQTTEKANIAPSGIFSMCLPLGSGTNNMTVSVCNAATGYDIKGCPTVELDPMTSNGDASGIQWINAPKDFFSADLNPTVELSFKLPDVKADSCDSSEVTLLFNREAEQKLCAEADGTYRLNLEPSTGINIGIIQTPESSHPFTFGWGDMVSPFGKNGEIKDKDEFAIQTAGGFALSKTFITDTSRGLLNNYLSSDEFKELIKRLPQMMSGDDQSSSDTGDTDAVAKIQQEIPQCKASPDDGSGIGFKISREPQFSLIELPQIEFGQDLISLRLNVDDLKLWAQAYVDKDGDGQADKRVLPLRIGFKKIFSPIEIRVNRNAKNPIFLLTGPSTDCAYKKQHACDGKPAILVPKDFVGNATAGGSFVACDEQVDPDCIGVNMLDSQTALISTTVLDAVNDLLYCKGSALLTYIIREKMKQVEIPVDILNGHKWVVPVGLDLLSNRFNVTKDGIWGTVPAVVGSKEFYSTFNKELMTPETGFIKRPFLRASPSLASASGPASAYDMGIAIGEDLINALLFVLTEQNGNGVLDWDYHEVFLKQLGFDTVKRCDEFKPTAEEDSPPTLCNLRPRVGELLGSALTANNYFSQKQPIMMRIRGNRKLPPRVGFFNIAGKQYLDVQLGEADVLFYALQTDTNAPSDQYGNPVLLLQSNGDPTILSMNPNDPNPENGPIVRFKLSAQIALEVSKFFTDPEDPSKFAITIRTEPSLSKIVFKPVAGGNATVIPDNGLISALNEKINYGINIYADPKNSLKLGLPKDYSFANDTGSTDQFQVLGLQSLSFGKDGLQIGVEESQEYVDLLVKLMLTQTLTFNGQKQTFTFPN